MQAHLNSGRGVINVFAPTEANGFRHDIEVRDDFATDGSFGGSDVYDITITWSCVHDNAPQKTSTQGDTLGLAARNLAFFVQVHGEGVWCQDGEFFAEYFDDLDLAGNPLATQCEVGVPNWHWHVTSEGVPPPLLGRTRTLAPKLFSARWTTRINMTKASEYVFSSYANRGSRIIVDGSTMLDEWEEGDSTFTSEPVQLAEGYHIVAYEYHSGYSTDYSPTDSFAELSWSLRGEVFDAASGAHSTTMVDTAHELNAEVGWLACSAGRGTIHTSSFLSGMVAADVTRGLTTRINFGARFDNTPILLASVISTGGLRAHLRLLEASEQQVSIATEYDACDFIVGGQHHLLSWIAMGAQGLAVLQRPTRAQDVAALLSIRESLGLPEHLQWRNGSDPCTDRWAGVECRAGAGENPRVIVLDVRPALSTPCIKYSP
jgi:hypothetical protein